MGTTKGRISNGKQKPFDSRKPSLRSRAIILLFRIFGKKNIFFTQRKSATFHELTRAYHLCNYTFCMPNIDNACFQIVSPLHSGISGHTFNLSPVSIAGDSSDDIDDFLIKLIGFGSARGNPSTYFRNTAMCEMETQIVGVLNGLSHPHMYSVFLSRASLARRSFFRAKKNVLFLRGAEKRTHG